jgi:hypothetical protein
MPCGQIGRSVQVWTSVTSPSAPLWIHSYTSRQPSPAWPWLPICVATLYFVGGLGEPAGLPRRVGERLLRVHVLAELHRDDRRRVVVMIGRADHDGVEVLVLFVEQLAIVGVGTGLGELLGVGAVARRVDVAVARALHTVRRGRLKVVAADAAGSDVRDAQIGQLRIGGLEELLVGLVAAAGVVLDEREGGLSGEVSDGGEAEAGGGGTLDEAAARGAVGVTHGNSLSRVMRNRIAMAAQAAACRELSALRPRAASRGVGT